jgi:hypothetical protein
MFSRRSLVAAAAILAGCGNDSSGSGGSGGGAPTPPGPLSFLSADLRIDKDVPGIEYLVNPIIARDGDLVYVFWIHADSTPSPVAELMMNRSSDGGSTWQADPVRVDHRPSVSSNFGDYAAAAVGNAVYLVWTDDREGDRDVYFNRSLDAGQTWLSSDVRLDHAADGVQASSLAFAVDGSRICAAWSDARDGTGFDVYLASSADGGQSWSASDALVSHGAGESAAVRLACSGTSVYAVWKDDRNGLPDIYANRSLDGGGAWLAVDRRLDTDVAGAAASIFPLIACSGSSVYVVWQDVRSGTQVRFNRSLDAGNAWLASDVELGAAAPNAQEPALVCSGSKVYVAWMDDRAGAWQIRFNRSADGGVTWLPADLRVDVGKAEGSSTSSYPSLAADGDHVHALWYDFRDGDSDPYYNYSADGGFTWLPAGLGAAHQPDPFDATAGHGLAVDESHACVVWNDDREFPEAGRIYANRIRH